MSALIRQLPGTQLVMLYLIFGNTDARLEIMERIRGEKEFNEQQDALRKAAAK